MTQKLTLKDFDAQMAVEKEMKQAMTTAHETKARSIVRSGFDCADVKMRDGEMLVSAIATALREAEAGERERIVKLLMRRAEHHRTELDLAISDTAKAVRDHLQAELFELAATTRGRTETDE